jgi:hypothetical protein
VPAVAQGRANAYGVHDLHGLVWEWTEDYAGMLVSGDSREQKADDRLKFCGAGAIAMDDKENYAVLMRVAMLSSLEGANITSNLGFRCARPLTGKKPMTGLLAPPSPPPGAGCCRAALAGRAPPLPSPARATRCCAWTTSQRPAGPSFTLAQRRGTCSW